MAKVKFPTEYLDDGGPFEKMGNEAKRKHATGGYNNSKSWYHIEDQFLPPGKANQLVAAPNTEITGYAIKRFIKISSLDEEVNSKLPGNSVTEDGVIRRLKWSEVNERSTVDIQKRNDGFYYPDATAADNFRGLSLDEYNAITIELIEADNIPSFPDIPS